MELGHQWSFPSHPRYLQEVHVCRTRWLNHVPELSRIILKPIINNIDSVTGSIIILELFNVIGVHKRLPVISKWHNSVFLLMTDRFDQLVQLMPEKQFPDHDFLNKMRVCNLTFCQSHDCWYFSVSLNSINSQNVREIH